MRAQTTDALQTLIEALTREQLHHDVRRLFVEPVVERSYDVVADQSGGSLGFATEPAPHRRRFRQVFVDKLDGA